MPKIILVNCGNDDCRKKKCTGCCIDDNGRKRLLLSDIISDDARRKLFELKKELEKRE